MSNERTLKKPINMEQRLKEAQTKGDVQVDAGKTRNTRFPPPPMTPAKPTMETIKAELAKIPAFQLKQSLYFKGANGAATGKIVKFSYPTTTTGADGAAYNQIRLHFGEDSKRWDELQTRIDDTIVTNNTEMAAMKRLQNELPPLEADIAKTDIMALRKYLHERLPIKVLDDVIDKFPGFEEAPDGMFDIIASADAGFPFMATNREAKCGDLDVYLEAKKLALKYVGILADPLSLTPPTPSAPNNGAFLKYMRENPIEFTYLQKRKYERTSRENFDTKCRVYYVAPFALKLLYKWVAFYVMKQHLNFTENEKSSSAYGFCWSKGGADQLVSWVIKNRTKSSTSGKVVYDALCFGDDQYWTITYPDGTVALTAPDVKGMDMKVPQSVGALLQKNHEDSFRVKPCAAYLNVARLLFKHSFVQNVLVQDALVACKMWGLISGIPLTTVIDIYGSVVLQYYASRVFEKTLPKTYDSASFGKSYSVARKRVKEGCGFIFKDETCTHIVVSPDQKFGSFDVPLHFLGNRMEYDSEERHYFPVPSDLDKVFVHLATPATRPGKGLTASASHMMSRIFGLCLSGGALDDDFYEVVTPLFELALKTGGKVTTLADVGGFTLAPGDEEAFEMAGVLGPFTKRQVKFFYMYGMEEALKLNESTASSYVPSVGQVSSTLAVEEDFSLFDFDETSAELDQVSLTTGSITTPTIKSDQVGKLISQKKKVPAGTAPMKPSGKSMVLPQKPRKSKKQKGTVIKYDVDEETIEEVETTFSDPALEEIRARIARDQEEVERLMREHLKKEETLESEDDDDEFLDFESEEENFGFDYDEDNLDTY